MKKLNKILMFTDASDAPGGTSATPPPLADDTNLMEGYEPGTPLLDPGSFPMKIVKTETVIKDGKPNAAHTIKLALSNVETMRDTKGNVLQPGEAMVFAQVNTVVTGKSTPKLVKDGVAYVLQAAGVDGLNSVRAFQENHKLLEGAVVYVKLDTTPASVNRTTGQSYDARTEVKKWWRKGQTSE